MSAQQRAPSSNRSTKRRPLSPSLIADIAEERFGGLSLRGTPTPISKLAKQYQRAPSVISRAIARAFTEHLVEVRRISVPEEPRHLEDLEDKLLQAHPKLLKAIVIESAPTEDFPSLSDPLQDPLQRNLGTAMARYIATGSVLRNGDIIGIGSGRGVELTIRSLRFFASLRARDVTLMSLTGSVYSTPNKKKGLWLDADRHVIEAARHFIQEPKQYLIGHPLAYEPNELTKARQRTWLRAGSSNAIRTSPPPSLSLLGVGIFAEGHRSYVEAEAAPEDREPFLEPIHDLLAELKDLSIKALPKQQAREYSTYSPAAEMSNFFFFVPPPKGATISGKARISDCIDRINSRLLNIQKDQIRGMQLMVVAGTKKKAHALKELLSNEEYRVTHLCTDSAAARAVLGM